MRCSVNHRGTLIVALWVLLATAVPPTAIAQSGKPNDGKAETIGKVIGGVAGAAAGAAVGGARGGAAGAGAGGTAGQMTGERIGASAGRYLDERAEENKRTGRGGPDDPRFNPFSLFNR